MERRDLPPTSLLGQDGLAAPGPLGGVSRRRLLAAPLLLGLAPPALALADGPRSAGGGLVQSGPLPAAAAQTDLPTAVSARLTAAMREAIGEARQAVYAFGAVLLDVGTGQTVFRAHNTGENGDPTAHGEVNALRGAGIAGINLTRTVLVTTAEPCPMCAAASVWAQVAGIVFGTSITSLIEFGWGQLDLAASTVVSYSPYGPLPIVGGVLTAETDPLYAAGQPSAPPPKA